MKRAPDAPTPRWWATRRRSIAKLDVVRAFAIDVLREHGVPKKKAEFASDAWIDKDVQGDFLRGLVELPRIVTAFRGGELDPNPRLRLVVDDDALAVAEGQGFFFCLGYDALEICMRKARASGIAMVGVRAQIGRLEPYVARASNAGLVAFGSILAPPLMAAHPSSRARIGNNPFGLAARGNRGELVFDAAMSMSTAKPILHRAAEGGSLPAAVVYDSRGRATTNAKAFRESADGSAARGSLVPIGAHKGYGLATALGVLSGVLIGDWTRAHGARHPDLGSILFCIDPSRLGSPHAFRDALDDYFAWLTSCTDGAYPGSSTRGRIAEARRANALPLAAPTLRALRAVAKDASRRSPV